MIQEIAVYIILGISFGIIIFKSLSFFEILKNNNSSACTTCASGGCASCSLRMNKDFTLPVQSLKISKK